MNNKNNSEMYHAALKILNTRSEQLSNDELMHYGTPRHSGRYPYGSGERPHQHDKTNLGSQLNNVMNDLNESVKRHLELDKFKDEISTDFSNLKNQIKDTINASKSKRQNNQNYSNDALAQEVEKVYKSKPLKDYKNESEQQIAIKKIADVSNETYDLKNRKPYKQIVSDIDSLIQDHANNLKQGRDGWTFKDGSSLNSKYEPKMIKDFQDLHADMMENLEKQGINISNITGSNNRDRQFYIISYGDPNKNNKLDLTIGACNPLWELFDDNSCADRDLFLDWYDNEFVLTPEEFYSMN